MVVKFFRATELLKFEYHRPERDRWIEPLSFLFVYRTICVIVKDTSIKLP